MPKDKNSGKKLADMMYGNPDRAAFGITPMIGKRREDRQDREAAKSFPVDLARGVLAGAVGMPGDIESLARLPYELITGNESPTFLPTSEDVLKRIPFGTNTPAGQFASGLGTLAGGSANLGAIPRAVKAAPGALKTAARNLSTPSTLNPQAGVIKTKGGNFLTGSVEGALKPLKRSGGLTPQDIVETEAHLEKIRPSYDLNNPKDARQLREMEDHVRALKSNLALDNWVDRNLGNYVKKEMATPEDPVRRLAEEGITHMPQGEIDFANQFMPEQLAVKRMMAGFDPGDAGVSNAAKGWERITDEMLNVGTAGQHTRPLTPTEIRQGYKSTVDDNPWLTKLDPSTPVYYPENMDSMSRDLGFDHILDVLREDLTSGRIRPEQLSKVSMEQAVRRTAEYDQELAAKMNAERTAKRDGLPVYKEYPEGYRWVELNKPGSFASESEAMGHSVRGYEPPQGHPDWTEGSGEAGSLGYGHGGWEAIKSGKAKVYSLVDSKGQPHTTVEVKASELSPLQRRKIQDQVEKETGIPFYKSPGTPAEARYKELLKEAENNLAHQITQIKGKQNAAPKEDYLPFVQDFVRSGQWSDVGDLGNTGLYKADPGELGMFIPSDPRLKNLPGRRTEDFEKAKEAGLFGDQKYFTRNEWEDILRKQIESESGPLPPLPEEGMAHGGRVHFTDNPDVMQLELAGGGLVKGLKAAAKAVKAGADLPVVEAPSIIIPSKVQTVKEAARQSKGEYGAKRVERAADEIRNLEKMYNEKALREAFLGDNAKAVVTMDPADFERYAQILKGRTKADIGPKMAELAKQGEIDKYTLPMDEYIQHLMRVQGGFDQAPYLNLYKDEVGIPSMPEVRGHEGRHRSRALSEAGESKGLVQISPRGDLREGLPRGSQEEYIEALRQELERSGRLVIPEVDGSYRRPAVELPEPYAEGGAVRMQAGGLAKAVKALKAAKEAPMKASEALGRIEGRPLVITQADRTKVGGGFLGGPGFSGLQLEDPAYRAAEAAWGVKTPGVAKMILGGGKAAGKDPVYAAMLGTPTQHQSNQMVFDKLYGDFKKAAKKGDLDQDLRDRINMRLANSVDKDGNPIFPPDVDILGKNFKDLASTFDRRAVTANLIGGMGVGGKKGQIIDYDKIIRQTTDPALIDAPTGAIGNRLFTLSGGIIDRPDLHPAFPTILQGEDLGVSFDPVVRELIMKDFMEKTMREKGRAPGVFDYTRGYPPSQLITEDILTEMQKLGLKKGGAVHKAAGGEITADDLILEERKL